MDQTSIQTSKVLMSIGGIVGLESQCHSGNVAEKMNLSHEFI